MKAFLTFFILYFFSLSVSAQQFKRIFLFNDFVQAQIKFRNHSVSVVSLNYDASNKTMLFRQGEEMMEMTNPAQVDTVIIGKRKFVPVGRGFYEVVCRKEGVVYIDWLLKDVNIGSKGAMGTVYTPYERQKIGSTEVYRRKNDNTYYIKVEGKLEKVKSLKHLEKIFIGHKDEIRKFAKDHKIDMKDILDVFSILDYCMELEQ